MPFTLFSHYIHIIFTHFSLWTFNKIKPSREQILSLWFLLGSLGRHWLEIFSCPQPSVLPAQLFLQWAVIWIRKPIQLKNNPAKRFIFILLLKLNPLLCLQNIYANNCPNAIESIQESCQLYCSPCLFVIPFSFLGITNNIFPIIFHPSCPQFCTFCQSVVD